MLYLIDASTLMRANNSYYPIQSVPEFWEWALHHAEQGHIKIPFEIFEEIKDGPNNKDKDALYGWIQELDVKNALLLDEAVDDTLVQKAIMAGYAPDLTDTEVEQVGRDPFLIAYAMVSPSTRVVVTCEVSKPSRTRQNRHLPDVCNSLGIQWCDPFTLNRALGFRTNWKSHP